MYFGFLLNSAIRRWEKFKVFTTVGLLLLVWKVSYDSISWHYNPFSFADVELGAGNATLGVRHHHPVAHALKLTRY